jgi:hypothetical protein
MVFLHHRWLRMDGVSVILHQIQALDQAFPRVDMYQCGFGRAVSASPTLRKEKALHEAEPLNLRSVLPFFTTEGEKK